MREVAKGLVTKNIKILNDCLVIEDGQFMFDKIDNDMAKEAYHKLNIAHDQFDDLHERHLYHALSLFDEEYRENKTDLAYYEFENETLENVESYAHEVSKEFFKSQRAYIKYTKALASSIDDKKKAVEVKAEDSARKTKIVPLADAMERKRTKSEENSIKFPVDVGVENAIMKAKVDEVEKHEDSAYSRQEIPEQPIHDPPFKIVIANTNVNEDDIEKLETHHECIISNQDIPERSNDVSNTDVIAVDEYQNISDKLADHSINDDANKEKHPPIPISLITLFFALEIGFFII